MDLKSVTRFHGILDNAKMEPTIHGFSLFDKNNEFIGEILDEGFAINTKYKLYDQVYRMVHNRGIPIFDYDTFYEIKSQNEIETLTQTLYSEPKKTLK